ncbi:MAG: hypothetical protein JNM69_16510 [Archangium sp.]|nr:hypothetical protein [Archangium sp.]
MATRRRSWFWLVLAAGLLIVGAWLMVGAEPPPRPPPPVVKLPKHMTDGEQQRAQQRETFVPLPLVDAGVEQAAAPPPRPRDPLLAMMPSTVKRGAVVAEVSAILNSELGALVLDCVTAGGRSDLDQLRDAGFDPMVHLDRIALVDGVAVITGQLEHAPMPSGPASDYGPRTKLYELGDARTTAVWNRQVVLTGPDAEVRAMLDRLEHGDPAARPVLDPSEAYGEVYGTLAPSALADLFGDEEPRLRDVILQTTRGVSLHVDVSHDVGVVADVAANDGSKTDELRRSIGSLLSIARLRAQSQGRTSQADLLELARVRAGSGSGFRVEAGAPNELVKSMLQRCVERQNQRAAGRSSDGG